MTTQPTLDRIVVELRSICSELPDSFEEHAWVGTRWRIRTRTFAHVLPIDDGWPPAYARAAGADGPALVLMIRAQGPDLDLLSHVGEPFFTTPWRHDEIGVHLTNDTDWNEIADLVADSYCTQAPRRLAQLVQQRRSGPPEPDPPTGEELPE